MPSLNKVMLIGNLGRAPEVRYMPDGSAVCSFSIATTERWKDKHTGQSQEKTEWHNIAVYRRLAVIAGEYLERGSAVYVEGHLHTRKWQDKTTGKDRYSTEIIAEAFQMLGNSSDKAHTNTEDAEPVPNARRGMRNRAEQSEAMDDFVDDIPF